MPVMTLHLNASFSFDLEHDCDALLQFEAALMPDQHLISSDTQIANANTLNRVPAQDGIGQRIWINASGRVDVHYKAQVKVKRSASDLLPLKARRAHQLPGEAVKYLLGSRYCNPGQFVDFVDEQFGTTKGGERVAAIRDWVECHIAYTPGASTSDTSASDTFYSGQGICRDYAHLFIMLARASTIPARYVACYAPGVQPQDFHAVAQVYLETDEQADRPCGGAWHLVDPTGMADLSQTAIIGVGRDAGDVSFLTSFGPMQFMSSNVQLTQP